MIDIVELIDFYRTPVGKYRTQALMRRLRPMLPSHFGGEAVSLGYTLPLLPHLPQPLARAPVLMMESQGVCRYPDAGANRAAPVDPAALPLSDSGVGLLLAAHWLEHTDPAAAVREIARVLIPCGEALVIAGNRFSPWTRVESAPEGCGAPFSRGRLRRLFHAADLSIVAIETAVFAPPLPENLLLRSAAVFECIGPTLLRRFAAVHLVRVRKEVYGLHPPQASAVKRRKLLRPGICYNRSR